MAENKNILYLMVKFLREKMGISSGARSILKVVQCGIQNR